MIAPDGPAAGGIVTGVGGVLSGVSAGMDVLNKTGDWQKALGVGFGNAAISIAEGTEITLAVATTVALIPEGPPGWAAAAAMDATVVGSVLYLEQTKADLLKAIATG